MKNPNGYGNLTFLKGNRRKPYWVRVTVGWSVNEKTGKPKQLTKTIGYYKTRREAMLALANYNSNPYDLDNQNITFEEIWEKWSEEHFEKFPSSERGLRAAFKKCPSLHKMKIKDIKSNHLKEVMKSISHMSPESQARVKSIFKNVFAFALENDIVQKDYSQFVNVDRTKQTDTKKKKKYFTREEVELIFNNLDFEVEYPYGVKHYTTMNLTDSVVILIYTGMRISELLNLKCEDIDLEARTIHVHGTKTDNAERVVPIHKNVIPYIKARMGKTYLFENVNGKRFVYKTYLYTFFQAYMEHLGLEGKPHATRHTFVSLMDNAGVSARSVVLKRIVGHSNDSVTEDYTHKEISMLIEAIDQLDL